MKRASLNSSRRGAVLIFILYATLFLSVMIVYIVRYASDEIRMRAPNIYYSDLRHDAYNVLYAAFSELKEYKETDGGYYSYGQGWATLAADGRAMLPKGLNVKVAVTDENAKLPLSKLTAEQLAALLYEMGLPEANLQEISNTIVDWMDTDDAVLPSGAEKEDYDPESALPPNRIMRSLNELKHVKEASHYFFDESGRPNDYYKMFASAVSPYSDTVNLNNASELVLRALFKMDEIDFDENLPRALRGETGGVSDGIYWVKNVAEIGNRGASVPLKYAGAQSKILRLDVEASRGLGAFRLTAYCDVSDSLKVVQIIEGGKD